MLVLVIVIVIAIAISVYALTPSTLPKSRIRHPVREPAHFALDIDHAEAPVMRRHQRTARPLGDAAFTAGLESQLGRFLRERKPGPKRKENTN